MTGEIKHIEPSGLSLAPSFPLVMLLLDDISILIRDRDKMWIDLDNQLGNV